ncbi:hypothetical protein Acr_12g0006240 [Actinidia rufa]|uniref:Uncharacterized protein n=1 Tax=Actinidia rufa TaxID=165716 RepID=A0A7J0FHM0_9ERIC|nr:hypothetical protein Acr_12g0006240 [Actinidia rufa]
MCQSPSGCVGRVAESRFDTPNFMQCVEARLASDFNATCEICSDLRRNYSGDSAWQTGDSKGCSFESSGGTFRVSKENKEMLRERKTEGLYRLEGSVQTGGADVRHESSGTSEKNGQRKQLLHRGTQSKGRGRRDGATATHKVMYFAAHPMGGARHLDLTRELDQKLSDGRLEDIRLHSNGQEGEIVGYLKSSFAAIFHCQEWRLSPPLYKVALLE